MPIVFGGEQIGCAPFAAARMGPLGTIARRIGAGLRNARLHAEVLRLSLTNPLSGLRNRTYLEFVLEDAFEQSKRYGRPTSILMLDIDRFKGYDDSFGHPAAGVALHEVAEAVRSVTRDADVLARYGGEEFIMVMAETDSAGVASLSSTARADVSVQAPLERADRCDVVTSRVDAPGSAARRGGGARRRARRRAAPARGPTGRSAGPTPSRGRAPRAR